MPALESGLTDTLRDCEWTVGLIDVYLAAPRKPGPAKGTKYWGGSISAPNTRRSVVAVFDRIRRSCEWRMDGTRRTMARSLCTRRRHSCSWG